MAVDHSPHCSNCGHSLVVYRTDRSWTVRRQVETQWFTCPRCAHMSIQYWSVIDAVDESFPAENSALDGVLASA